ncbi:50S ribosomal protein L4, partial [Arthrospira platensis SPKY1]|nr:50S ribosomal protein L4 [Arthrospira platensis SPKY1]
QFLANQRQGTHKTKVRSEVARTTKKAFRQKGTGGARRGSYKSPIVRGGGTIFGPQPRDYGFSMNRKQKALARASALTLKAQANGIVVVNDFAMDAPKTKGFLEILKNLSIEGKKVLFLT